MEHQTITNIHIFNKMRKALFCLAAIMIAAVVNAQEHRGMRPQQREFNPEDMAAMQTNRMHQVVNLDSTQYQAIFLINYNYCSRVFVFIFIGNLKSYVSRTVINNNNFDIIVSLRQCTVDCFSHIVTSVVNGNNDGY